MSMEPETDLYAFDGPQPFAASAGYERRLAAADKRIHDIRRLYDEWRESKDDGLVTAIFQRAVAAINAASNS